MLLASQAETRQMKLVGYGKVTLLKGRAGACKGDDLACAGQAVPDWLVSGSLSGKAKPQSSHISAGA